MIYWALFLLAVFLRVISVMKHTNETANKIANFISLILILAIIAIIVIALNN